MGRKKLNKRLVIPRLLFVPLAFLAIVSHHIYADEGAIDVTFETIGFLLLLAGTVGRIWVSAYISGKKNREIVAEGPYSIVRHPLYFFNFLAYVGAGFACESLTIVAALTILYFATHWPTMLAEENHLREEFGSQYAAYAQSVPRLIPTTWRLKNPESISFVPTLFNWAVLEGSLIMSLYIAIQLFEWGQLNGYIPIWYRIP